MDKREAIKRKKMAEEKVDKLFKQVLKENEQMREFFRNNPDKAEAYKRKMLDDMEW